jgi:hypothetical protein
MLALLPAEEQKHGKKKRRRSRRDRDRERERERKERKEKKRGKLLKRHTLERWIKRRKDVSCNSSLWRYRLRLFPAKRRSSQPSQFYYRIKKKKELVFR